MEPTTIFWIIAGWVFLNAALPLLINSIERQYQAKIDTAVRWMIQQTTKAVLGLLQLFFVVIFAPNIILFGILERLCPRVLETNWIKNTHVHPVMHLVLTKEFWPVFAAAARESTQANKSIE